MPERAICLCLAVGCADDGLTACLLEWGRIRAERTLTGQASLEIVRLSFKTFSRPAFSRLGGIGDDCIYGDATGRFLSGRNARHAGKSPSGGFQRS